VRLFRAGRLLFFGNLGAHAGRRRSLDPPPDPGGLRCRRWSPRSSWAWRVTRLVGQGWGSRAMSLQAGSRALLGQCRLHGACRSAIAAFGLSRACRPAHGLTVIVTGVGAVDGVRRHADRTRRVAAGRGPCADVSCAAAFNVARRNPLPLSIALGMGLFRFGSADAGAGREVDRHLLGAAGGAGAHSSRSGSSCPTNLVKSGLAEAGLMTDDQASVCSPCWLS